MIDDLQNICISNTVNRLACLVVIHQNHPFFTQIQQVPAGDHTDIIAILIQDWEIAVPFLSHDAADIFCLLCYLKRNQSIFFHKMRDWHTLIDHTCNSKCIMRCHNDAAVMLLRQLLDRLRYLCSHADNDAGSIHLDGTKLGFVTVSKNDHISLMDVILHYVRVGCCNDHFALIKYCIRFTDQ